MHRKKQHRHLLFSAELLSLFESNQIRNEQDVGDTVAGPVTGHASRHYIIWRLDISYHLIQFHLTGSKLEQRLTA